eukprot:4311711-Amphidinium_carterae.1
MHWEDALFGMLCHDSSVAGKKEVKVANIKSAEATLQSAMRCIPASYFFSEGNNNCMFWLPSDG